mmetsp:Transcript_25273/g.32969  ORF Transcript_25273/g.32969 Transcript_25273/m.32969 type:complete len:343 (+) Transcript_25273:142-1170(+)|eukprot:CAMPEP_0117744436 /NCGR_PEP_ID=MMETSP0947-20121206/6755_1 /TAXON_ID=44440 /ORGANISM="Chattonella subsalsa, Strain CCMP2191" /LENGTH=342 /DNA_ID=CAMNT_0005561379 /DNA_START=140 /DNA_END=1168 /DNA_ORIENTATION=+
MITLEDLDFSKSNWDLPTERPCIIDVDDSTGEFLSPIQRVSASRVRSTRATSRKGAISTQRAKSPEYQRIGSAVYTPTLSRKGRRPHSSRHGKAALSSRNELKLPSAFLEEHHTRSGVSPEGFNQSIQRVTSPQIRSGLNSLQTNREIPNIIEKKSNTNSMEDFFGRGGSAAPARRPNSRTPNDILSHLPDLGGEDTIAFGLRSGGNSPQKQINQSGWGTQRATTSYGILPSRTWKEDSTNSALFLRQVGGLDISDMKKKAPHVPSSAVQEKNTQTGDHLFSKTFPSGKRTSRPRSRRGKRNDNLFFQPAMHLVSSRDELRKTFSNNTLLSSQGVRSQQYGT